MAEVTNNKNFMQPTQFSIVIDRENYPNITFFAQDVTHPDVGASPVSLSHKGTTVFMPGDTIDYGTLTMSAIIDEDMNTYTEMYNWVRRNMTEYKTGIGANTSGTSSTSDITVNILNSHNNKVKGIRYRNAFPTNVSGIAFTTKTTETYLIFDITFQIDSFELI